MKPDTIREMATPSVRPESSLEVLMQQQIMVIAEVAAQLAEHNEQIADLNEAVCRIANRLENWRSS